LTSPFPTFKSPCVKSCISGTHKICYLYV
jgi:predicted Fe-S protein YdhL (DUF1289 family)